jgi:hypothetical protein
VLEKSQQNVEPEAAKE